MGNEQGKGDGSSAGGGQTKRAAAAGKPVRQPSAPRVNQNANPTGTSAQQTQLNASAGAGGGGGGANAAASSSAKPTMLTVEDPNGQAVQHTPVDNGDAAAGGTGPSGKAGDNDGGRSQSRSRSRSRSKGSGSKGAGQRSRSGSRNNAEHAKFEDAAAAAAAADDEKREHEQGDSGEYDEDAIRQSDQYREWQQRQQQQRQQRQDDADSEASNKENYAYAGGPMASPSDMESIARSLNVDLSRELYLIPLVRGFSAMGLPPGWRQELFMDDDTTGLEPHRGAQQTARHVAPKSSAAGSTRVARPCIVAFVHEPTGRFTVQRPVVEEAAERVAEARREHFERPHDASQPSAWVEFRRRRGGVYYYNFKTRTSSSHIPDPKRPALGTDTLRFKSWWTLAGKRQYIRIAYRLHEQAFVVNIDNDDNTYVLRDLTSHGIDVLAIDLYVGATLNVLGREITLHQCNHSTKCWLEENVKRVQRVQQLLETQLAKYTNKPIHGRYHATKDKSETNLRALLVDVSKLRDALRVFRPSLADAPKFQTQLEW